MQTRFLSPASAAVPQELATSPAELIPQSCTSSAAVPQAELISDIQWPKTDTIVQWTCYDIMIQ